jgi:3-methyladenine DNA glycosylase AlkD
MAVKKKVAPKKAKAVAPDAKAVLAELKRNSSASYKADMAKRYGIVTKAPVYGVTVATLRAMAKRIGYDHALAEELWSSGIHDARMLATMVDDPADVTPAQMERWVKDMDNWGIVDTACFHYWDRVPLTRSKNGRKRRTSSSSARRSHCSRVARYTSKARTNRCCAVLS